VGENLHQQHQARRTIMMALRAISGCPDTG